MTDKEAEETAMSEERYCEIVRLSPGQTMIGIDLSRRNKAIDVAMRITLSPHEWTWTPEEQFDMAAYVLWAHQRLSGIDQLVNGDLQVGGDSHE